MTAAVAPQGTFCLYVCLRGLGLCSPSSSPSHPHPTPMPSPHTLCPLIPLSNPPPTLPPTGPPLLLQERSQRQRHLSLWRRPGRRAAVHPKRQQDHLPRAGAVGEKDGPRRAPTRVVHRRRACDDGQEQPVLQPDVQDASRGPRWGGLGLCVFGGAWLDWGVGSWGKAWACY